MPFRAFLSVDVAGSTLLKHGASDEAIRRTFSAYHRYVRDRVRRHGGSVVSVSGDGVMARYGAAPAAVRSAMAIQGGLRDFNRRRNRLAQGIRVRVGLSAGDVRAGLDARAADPILDAAGTLQKAAKPGEILASGAVYDRMGALRRTFTYRRFDAAIAAEIYVHQTSIDWDDLSIFRDSAYDEGYLLLQENDFRGAERYFERALRRAERARKPRWVAACLHGLAFAAGRQRKNTKKIRICRRLIVLEERLGNLRGIQLAHFDLFYALYWSARDDERLGRFPVARRRYREALASARITENAGLIRQAERNLLDLESFLSIRRGRLRPTRRPVH